MNEDTAAARELGRLTAAVEANTAAVERLANMVDRLDEKLDVHQALDERRFGEIQTWRAGEEGEKRVRDGKSSRVRGFVEHFVYPIGSGGLMGLGMHLFFGGK